MEDFVPFELAKKLKEKGFREKVNAYYGKRENIFNIHPALDMNDSDYRTSAPTISQVLKWLREEKEFHIVIDVWRGVWGCGVLSLPSGNSQYWIGYREDIKSYELAALAGIEYAIDNLI